MRAPKKVTGAPSGIFSAALAITMMIAVAAAAGLTALHRMESTMCAEEFTVFLLEKQGDDTCRLTSLNQTRQIDLTEFRQKRKQLEEWRVLEPAGVRVFFLAFDQLAEGLRGLLVSPAG